MRVRVSPLAPFLVPTEGFMSKKTVAKTASEAVDVKIDSLSNLERKLTIIVPVSHIEEKQAEEFRKLAQHAQVKGYRKGKVPMPMLKKFYGKSVHDEVIRKLVDESLSNAIKDNALQPAGGIQIDTLEAELGKPLKIEATFEVIPEIKLGDMAELQVEKFKVDITEADINQKLKALRAQNASWLPTQEAAKKGDRVKVDYEGEVDGKSFPGGSNQGVSVEIGKETLIAGFEDKLVGAKAGDDLSFDVKFPKDYGIKELEGKKAHFKVKVHEVSVSELPELDDNFAKKLDVQGGLDALKQKLKEHMEEDLKQVIQENLRHQVVEQLFKKYPIEPPKALVENEIKAMQAQVKQQFAHMMKGGSFPELPREHFEEQAGKKVAVSLIFSELVKKYELKPDQERLQKKIETMTAHYPGNADAMMKWLADNENAKQQLMFAVLEEQVIDKILEEAQVKEKVTHYHDAVEWKKSEEKTK